MKWIDVPKTSSLLALGLLCACSSGDGDDSLASGGSAGTVAAGGSAGLGTGGVGNGGAGGAAGSATGGGAGAAGAPSEQLRIRFDYRMDDAGYFDEPKRRVLEEAARRWTARLPGHFPPLPDQTAFWVVDPEDPEGPSREFVVDTWDADIIVFVGITEAQSGGATTWNFFTPHESWSNALANTLHDRLGSSTAYQPFLSSISFNPNRPRAIFVDPTPESDNDVPVDEYDLMNTAVHELGHVLGITSFNDIFFGLQSGNNYVGAAIELNGNVPVPMENASHFTQDFVVGGEMVCMDPLSYPGERRLPSLFEHWVLRDVGYLIAE